MIKIEKISENEKLVRMRSDDQIRASFFMKEISDKDLCSSSVCFSVHYNKYGSDPEMDKLVDSPNEKDRIKAAQEGYAVHRLLHDPSEKVRLELVKSGYDWFPEWANDPSVLVRRAVAKCTPDIDLRLFAHDGDDQVRETIAERLRGKYDNQWKAADEFLQEVSHGTTVAELTHLDLAVAMSDSDRVIFSQWTDLPLASDEASKQALHEKLWHNGNEALVLYIESPKSNPFKMDELSALLTAMKKHERFLLGIVSTDTNVKRVHIIYDFTPKSIKDIKVSLVDDHQKKDNHSKTV